VEEFEQDNSLISIAKQLCFIWVLRSAGRRVAVYLRT